MVVTVEKNCGTVARHDWGDGQTKSDVQTNKFRQGQENLLPRGEKNHCPLTYSDRGAKSTLQTSHSADLVTQQVSVSTETVQDIQ